MIRTGRGPLRPVWRFTYATLIHALARVLRIASADAVYVRGSFASGEPIYGLSDLDLIAVTRRDSVSDAPRSQRLRQRIARVYDSLPVVKDAVELSVFEVGELERAAFSPFATYPYDPALGTATPRARFFGDSVRPQPFGARPDAGGRLYGPLRWWRLVAGRDYAAALPESPPEYRWLWAWSDLQFFWRHAPRRAVDPASAHTPYFSTKMIAEPAALWLWLQGEQRAPRAVDSLERTSVLMPEERETLERARELRKALPERTDSLLVEAFGFLLRVTFRITALLAEEVSRVGTTEIRLFGRAAEVVPAPTFDAAVAGLVPAGTALEPLPLVDWRARLGLELPDEALVLLPGDPADPKLVGAVALAAAESRNPSTRCEAATFSSCRTRAEVCVRSQPGRSAPSSARPPILSRSRSSMEGAAPRFQICPAGTRPNVPNAPCSSTARGSNPTTRSRRQASESWGCSSAPPAPPSSRRALTTATRSFR